MSDATISILEAGVGGQPLGAIEVMQGVTPVKIGKQTLVNQAGGEVNFAALGVLGSGAAADALRVHLSNEALAALESVTVSGTVALDSATLAALENVTVGGTVALDAPTLAALENITVNGTVELGATTLAALESITVQNGAGAAAVNIQDGGNSITVDGTITANLGTLNGAATAANQTNVQSAAGTANATVLNVQGNAGGVPMPVSGPLTDTQLRATPVPVSGPLTDTQLRATPVPVSGPLTDTQLRATAVPVSVGNFPATQTVSGTVTANQGTAGAQAWPVSDGGASLTVDGTVSVGNFPATQNVAVTGVGTAAGTPLFAQEVVGGAAVSPTNPVPTRNIPADLGVQVQSAAAAAVTLTIPAAGAGLFHYIDVLEIHVYATAARTGAAAPVTVTSTNLPGNPSWLFPTGQAIGTIDRYAFSGDRPMKSVAANTATTIVAPAVTGGIVQIKAIYSTGP